MLLGFFLFGTYSFWITTALVSFFLIACVEKIWAGWATLMLACAASVVFFSNGINPLSYIQEHPYDIAQWVCLHILIGAFWSVYRWYILLLKERRKIVKIKKAFLQKRHIEGDDVPVALREEWLFELKAHQYGRSYGEQGVYYERQDKIEFLREHSISIPSDDRLIEIPDRLKDEWRKRVQKISRELQFKMRPRPRDNKGLITLWMIYWPWSMAWYILNDPIKRFANWIYRRIQQMLEFISKHVWKDIAKDLPPTDI